MLIKNLSGHIDYGNSILVHPAEDLIARYNWLKSSDHDGKMGGLSANNRRTLILAPGIYTLTATLTLNTNYVDVVSLSGNPKDTIVSRGTGGATVEQTADDVVLICVTIKNTGSSGTDHAFKINASNNSPSFYYYMHLRQPQSPSAYPVIGFSDINGTWLFCEADKYAWRCLAGKNLGATMMNCNAGDSSYAGDTANAITGTFIRCTSGQYSFGGCGGVGCNITSAAWFEDCVASNNSYAMGKEFAGTAIRCKGGSNCFGGYSGSGSNYGIFSGYAQDCIVELGNNFGMGNSSCAVKGQIINCRIGGVDRYTRGALSSRVSNWTDAGAKATLTTNLTGNNNDLKYTAKCKGKEGNKISISYTGLAKGSLTVVVTEMAIDVRYNISSIPTAAQVKTAVEASTDAMALLESVENAPGNDGSGTITAMAATYLSGGIDRPYFKGNHPYVPSSHTVNTDVYPFDSGNTYTNKNATGGITFNLPSAWVGLKFTFLVMAGQNLDINPKDTEQIYDEGAGKGNGKYARSSAVGAAITLECIIDGRWDIVHKHGTWTYEP